MERWMLNISFRFVDGVVRDGVARRGRRVRATAVEGGRRKTLLGEGGMGAGSEAARARGIE